MLGNSEFVKALEETILREYGERWLYKFSWNKRKDREYRKQIKNLPKTSEGVHEIDPLSCSQCKKQLLHSSDRAHIYSYGICLDCHNYNEDLNVNSNFKQAPPKKQTS